MTRLTDLWRTQRPAVVLCALILLLTSVPVLHTYVVMGTSWWQGTPPTFTDESFYYARVQTIVKGHVSEGNPYFLEHADGPPLVLFAGAWLNALPQLVGISFNTSLLINFILWSLLFACALYWLLRELRVPSWIAVGATLLTYIQSCAHVWRAVNLQTVYPFYFLWYLALLRLLREQSQKHILFLGVITGTTFYLYAYLWQGAVITLGLLVLYAVIRKEWVLMRATFWASVIGGVIGLPVPLYAFWLSHTSPYFWESVGRLGLVNTHLPMAEIIYSGGWIGLVLVLLAVCFFQVRRLRTEGDSTQLFLFTAVGGLGLWIMQGSNLITGKLLETGEHVKLLIFPWLIFTTVSVAVCLWQYRREFSRGVASGVSVVLVVLIAVNGYYTFRYATPFLTSNMDRPTWELQQVALQPLQWLEQTEKNPVVVWVDPHTSVSSDLPIYSKNFTLYTWAGMMELVPEGEIRERYLISQYFNKPTVTDLKSDTEVGLYLGRHDLPHAAKTLEREVKLCRTLFFWNKAKDCGVIPTPQSLLGDAYFLALENKFSKDIVPNIKAYLAKYHVTYILKDVVLNPQYHPEKLGAVRVYSNERFELWHL